jgi:hypothetical protein
MLVAGDHLKVSGREVTVNGQLAIDALEDQQQFQVCGRGPTRKAPFARRAPARAAGVSRS